MTDSMPDWLRAQLIEKGYLSETGLSQKARIIRHRACGLPCLAGLDSDMCALEAYTDLAELSPLGEAEALLQGRRTYEYYPHRKHLRLRNHWSIRARPAGSGNPIFAEHHCEQPVPADWTVPTKPHKPAARQLKNKEIPF